MLYLGQYLYKGKIYSLVPRLFCHKQKTNPVVGDHMNCMYSGKSQMEGGGNSVVTFCRWDQILYSVKGNKYCKCSGSSLISKLPCHTMKMGFAARRR